MKHYFIYPRFKEYKNTENFPEDTTYFPIIEKSDYEKYFCNEHHFKPFYHIEYVLPILEEKLQFGYKRSDFTLSEDYDNDNDISYLTPKETHSYNIYDISTDTYIFDVDSSYLRHNLTKEGTGNSLYETTKYHQLFTFAHKSCLITNKNVNNDRKLVISCDSQMIPVIPILCHYFKEIWVLDKRDDYMCYVSLNAINPDDIIIAGGHYPSKKYIKDNFTVLQ
jgi:hypothetical protein